MKLKNILISDTDREQKVDVLHRRYEAIKSNNQYHLRRVNVIFSELIPNCSQSCRIFV